MLPDDALAGGAQLVSGWRRRRGVGCGRVHGHARSGWEAGMAQGGVSRGVCAGVVGVTLRAEGGFAGGVGAGRAAAWLCRCTDRAYADADERCCCFDVVADGAVLVCVCFVCWAHAVMIMMMAT